MKVLVLGDRIIDQYTYCKATRLSPEAPVPVLVPEKEVTSEGGASLVAHQLMRLLGPNNVLSEFGSMSQKHRIFADRTMIARIDRDSTSVVNHNAYWNQILRHLKIGDLTAVVAGDYAKGALPPNIASGLTAACIQAKIPLFVDAKHDVSQYKGCYAIFPNELEHNHLQAGDFENIIRKMGPRGCSINGRPVRTTEQQVYDVTGAGDIFLAAFVARWCRLDTPDLEACAEFANRVAGISVRHLGTHVVEPEEIQ